MFPLRVLLQKFQCGIIIVLFFAAFQAIGVRRVALHAKKDSRTGRIAAEFLPMAFFFANAGYGATFRFARMGLTSPLWLPLVQASIIISHVVYLRHLQVDVSLRPSRLCKISSAGILNFAIGSAWGAFLTLLLTGKLVRVDSHLLVHLLGTLPFALCFRGSALTGAAISELAVWSYSLYLPSIAKCQSSGSFGSHGSMHEGEDVRDEGQYTWTSNKDNPCMDVWVIECSGIIYYLYSSLLVLAGSTAGTCCDARRIALLWAHMTQCMYNGSFVTFLVVDSDKTFSDDATASVCLCCALAATHALTVACRMDRSWPSWSDGIKFLNVLELEKLRRSEELIPWVLIRQQDMPPTAFGDASKAKYVISVSHPWLSKGHADPHGIHLDIVLRVLMGRLLPVGRRAGHLQSIANYWRRYYYWYSGGDVLIFFDQSSLPQTPRTDSEEKLFKTALQHITLLFSILPVLVVPYIPQDVTILGRHITYIEKGWCWGEINTANVRGQLDQLSYDVKEKFLAQEELVTDENEWLSSLTGNPEIPIDDYDDLTAFLSARELQQKKCKVFTCGKADCNRVRQQLLAQQAKTLLQRYICAKNIVALRELLSSSRYMVLDYTPEHLVNEVLDGSFTTPLHLAVVAGDVDIVKELLAAGAKPRRNFRGDYPWELLGLPRLARAAFLFGVCRRSEPISPCLSGGSLVVQET